MSEGALRLGVLPTDAMRPDGRPERATRIRSTGATNARYRG